MKRFLYTLIFGGLLVAAVPAYSQNETKLDNGILASKVASFSNGALETNQQAWLGVPFSVMAQLADITPGPDTRIMYKDGILQVIAEPEVLAKVHTVVEGLEESVPYKTKLDPAYRRSDRKLVRMSTSWRLPAAFLAELKGQQFELQEKTEWQLAHGAWLYLKDASVADTEKMQQLAAAYIREHGEAQKPTKVTLPSAGTRHPNATVLPDPNFMIKSWVIPGMGREDQAFLKNLAGKLETVGGKMGGSNGEGWGMSSTEEVDGVYNCVIVGRSSDDKKLEQLGAVIDGQLNQYLVPIERSWRDISRRFLVSKLESMPKDKEQLAVEGLKAMGVRFDHKDSAASYDAGKKTLTVRLIKPQLEKVDTLVQKSQFIEQALRKSKKISGKFSESPRVYGLYCIDVDLAQWLKRIDEVESTREGIKPSGEGLNRLRELEGMQLIMFVGPGEDKKCIEKIRKLYKLKDPVVEMDKSVWVNNKLGFRGIYGNDICLYTSTGDFLEEGSISTTNVKDYDEIQTAAEKYLSKKRIDAKKGKKKKKGK